MTNLTPLVEEAARAICRNHGVDPDHVNADPRRHAIPREDGVIGIVSDWREPMWTMWVSDARAALGAINPDSEAGKALVGVMARAMHADGYTSELASLPDFAQAEYRSQARAALTAIATALKETALPTDREREDG